MILLIFSAMFLSFILFHIFSAYSYFGGDWHHLCLLQSPLSEYSLYYQALVCGQKLSQKSEGVRLQNMGLIHLFVVSGAHLHFLDQIFCVFKRVPFWKWLRLPLLFCFVVWTAFPITAFRAWLFIVSNEIDQSLKLHVPVHHKLLLSVLICLFLFPQEYNSLGLALSWMACLGLTISKNPFYQSTLIYFFTLPILLSLQLLSPWTILINVFFAPLVGPILFPASFLTYLVPPLSNLVDKLWFLFDQLAIFSQAFLESKQVNIERTAPFFIWLLCLFLHFASHTLNSPRKFRR